MSIAEQIKALGRDARAASRAMGRAPSRAKDLMLLRVADTLASSAPRIAEANQKDLDAAAENGLSGAKLNRLRLSAEVLADLSQGLREVAAMPDPVGSLTQMWKRPNGLQVGRMRIPLGVIGIIYESRPNVTIEAAALCIKAGNAVVLRGGSEAFHSNRCLAAILQEALEAEGLPKAAVQLVQTTDRQAVAELLTLEDDIDVMIPRGGEALIRFVAEHARMPVLKHYKGVCHVFVDRDADLDMATNIAVNAKAQRPGVCNAMETLLIHQDVAEAFLPKAAAALRKAGVELRGCARTRAFVSDCHEATEEDWHAEYLDLILAVRVVDDMEAAMSHIATYGSNHTEVIVTKDFQRAQDFIHGVPSSMVGVNASTRFNDGFQLGLGAEIGISTSRLHAFGPMGVEELTTTKFVVLGQGQIRT